METKIRKMTIQDLDSISSILESEFDDFWNYNTLKSELKNDNSIYVVCVQNSQIVGFAGITIILDTAELNNIVVKKTYRGKGFSSLLLNYLIKLAISKGCTKINLEVSKSNQVAYNLYQKFNFKKFWFRKNYYNKEDAILLTKEL